jgi:uncharacterized protein (DUF58 family)
MNGKDDRKTDTMAKISTWLETHWVAPAYSGWILIGIGLSFFGAATNTMAGWLYVLSGMILAILGLNAAVALRTVKKLTIERFPIAPVSAGDRLSVELVIKNPTKEAKTLLQIIERLPFSLSPSITTAIETIPPNDSYHWVYYLPTQKRGVYYWQELHLRTAAPLGVFYCRRSRHLPTKAIVYPQVLPLKHCPLVDSIGREESAKWQSDRLYQAATEGITKALRPYRFGDPIRLIHWRTSARLGELQVRELEVMTGGQEVIICLDNSPLWPEDYFEDAVTAAASLYFYARRCQLNVKLWTADTGLIQGSRVVLETLAGVEYGKDTTATYFPALPVIWISADTAYFEALSSGSRWLLFPPAAGQIPRHLNTSLPGIIFAPQESLESQLQKPLG